MLRTGATQETRAVAVSTPLGEDVLLLDRMVANERLSGLFEYTLDLLASDNDIKFEDVLGDNFTVRYELPRGEDKTRYFNGFVSHIRYLGQTREFAAYRATLRPWLWFLTQTSDCRIFQEMTVPDIIQQVFRDHGFTDFEDRLTGSYRKWEYNAQYRETDFNFVSRLMEQEGIYYFFEHEDGKHKLILADAYGAHAAYPDYEELLLRAPGQPTHEENILSWETRKTVLPGIFALNAYDFKKPNANLKVESPASREHAMANFEVYDLGEYLEASDGKNYAKVRIEELQAEYEIAEGSGDAGGIAVGYLMTLAEHPREDQNKEYLVTAASYEISSGGYESGGGGGDATEYRCTFTAMDSSEPFRAPRITPKPIIAGPQTAVVVGPSGEEIKTDEYGRVKLQFHWDRYGEANENSSCWVRVAQTWAGKGWGGMNIPRIGQEVIVEFLEGDPDQPIITGRVYNADNMPPYKLPGDATMSGLKSNSSKGGGGFNELRFEDKKDEEQIFMHAQKNLDLRVKNDRFETIENNRSLVVEVDKFEHIKNDRNETVDNHHKEKVGGDRNVNVEGKEAKAVKQSLSLTVDGDIAEVFKKNHSEQTTDDYYLKATNVVIEGTTNVTVKVGQSFIAIESSGIEIGTTGKITLDAKQDVEIKAAIGAKIEGKAQAELKSAMTKVEGSGIAELKGGLVKIN
jgi:type VI secretion system secreted protein VgrG